MKAIHTKNIKLKKKIKAKFSHEALSIFYKKDHEIQYPVLSVHLQQKIINNRNTCIWLHKELKSSSITVAAILTTPRP